MRRLPLFTWINFVNAFIILAALPVLNAALAMLLVDRQLAGGLCSVDMKEDVTFTADRPE